MRKVLTGFNLVNPKGEVVDLVTINPIELRNLRVVPRIETRANHPSPPVRPTDAEMHVRMDNEDEEKRARAETPAE